MWLTRWNREVSFESNSYCNNFVYAHDVYLAFELLSNQQFDYIFLDLNLSEDLDGLRVLEFVRKQKKHTPVFIMTGDSTVNTVEQVIKHLPTDYLVKPVSKVKIARCLDKLKIKSWAECDLI